MHTSVLNLVYSVSVSKLLDTKFSIYLGIYISRTYIHLVLNLVSYRFQVPRYASYLLLTGTKFSMAS